MCGEMTIDDAINTVRVLGDELAHHADRDIANLVRAATRIGFHIDEQSRELERERARRYGLGSPDARFLEGHLLSTGSDGGGRRDFLAGRGVHAGERLYLLTYAGWHPVRYESNRRRNEPLLYVPLPGVREDVVLRIPREARFAWPDDLDSQQIR